MVLIYHRMPHSQIWALIFRIKYSERALNRVVYISDFTALSFSQGLFSLTLNERFSTNGGYMGE